MKSFGYYSFVDIEEKSIINLCQNMRDDVEVFVNCAGAISRRASFVTHNQIGRDDYYLIYILRGTLSVIIDGVENEVCEGGIIIFPPKYKYKYTFKGSEEGILYYWIHFTGGNIDNILSKLHMSPLPLISKIGYSERIAEGFDRIFNSYIKADSFRDIEVACSFISILVDMARHIAHIDNEQRLSKSLTHIHLHYSEKIKIEDLARLENISVSRYNEIFKNIIGIPPLKYIINLRLQNACSLLSTTNMSVGQIAESVGFSEAHFFSKLFKKHIGCPPSKYKYTYTQNQN